MKRVLVCRLDNVGDGLLTGPTVRAVAAGSDRVTFLCSPQAAELLPGVDDVLVHSAGWISPGSEHFGPAAVTDYGLDRFLADWNAVFERVAA